jgi:cytochrome oxidase Cu insertion factor (SCO1/SenC/PrrC family)
VQVIEPTRPHHQRLARGFLWGAFSVVLVVVLGIGVFSVQRLSLSTHALEEALRPLGTVPDFALQERSGRSVTSTDLLGKVWIAAFIFTRCADECPLMSNRLARLQEAFTAAPNLLLVSITVDPEYDTPAVLSRYAESFGAHPQRWLFLTGEKAAILRLARDGFHLGVVAPREAQQSLHVPSAAPIQQVVGRMLWLLEPSLSWAHHGVHDQGKDQQALLHSARFVLVDGQGQIRQYYDSRDEDALFRLQQHAKYLLRR